MTQLPHSHLHSLSWVYHNSGVTRWDTLYIGNIHMLSWCYHTVANLISYNEDGNNNKPEYDAY